MSEKKHKADEQAQEPDVQEGEHRDYKETSGEENVRPGLLLEEPEEGTTGFDNLT